MAREFAFSPDEVEERKKKKSLRTGVRGERMSHNFAQTFLGSSFSFAGAKLWKNSSS
jgi:hypothetical protein